jgi:hypothetical protein
MDSFGFREWPFANVPTKERGVTLWADRAIARGQIDLILDDWVNTQRSSITLMWADLGSGKTHTLYNLRARCEGAGLLCFYVLLPTTITEFMGLYRAIARELDWTKVPISNFPNSGWSALNLKKILTWYLSDADVVRQNLAQRWLNADKLRQSECQMLGVARPISSPEEGVDVLALTVNSMTASGKRTVIMIDEYQRVAEGKRKHLQEIGHGIHTLYNACPNRFSLVLSCATGMSDDYTMVLTPELVSRLSTKRIELPYLSVEDIVCYMRDLFAHYRDSAAKHKDAFSPLTEQIAREFGDFLLNGLNGETTPRRINEAFDDLLSYMRHHRITSLDSTGFLAWNKQAGADLIKRIG